MSSPTGGSSAPNVDKSIAGLTDDGEPYWIVEGVAKGGATLSLGGDDHLDARVKCSKCSMVTLQLGFSAESHDNEHNVVQTIRIYGCTVCGNIMTKRA